MASLFKASQLRSAWLPEECGVFAAHKEFELLKLLSTADKKVISMARKMGHAAVNAQVNKHGNAGAPGQPPHTRHQDSRESECGRAASVSKTAREKRSKQERRQRQEAASKLQALARSFLVRQVELPAAQAAARNMDAHSCGELPEAPGLATGWVDAVRRRRRKRSPDSASRSDPASEASHTSSSLAREDRRYEGREDREDREDRERLAREERRERERIKNRGRICERIGKHTRRDDDALWRERRYLQEA